MQRYFSEKKENNFLYLSSDDFYHIYKVMRMNVNDLIEVVYNGTLFHTKLCDDVKVEIVEEVYSKEVLTNVTLIIPMLKEQKMDYILQKATELGVSEIIPFNATRSVVKLNGKEGKKIDRWQKICKEASEQSKRLSIPVVRDVCTLKELASCSGDKYICSTIEKDFTINKIFPINKNTKTIFVIGPEGGFDNSEESFLINNGFKPISLGPNILRAETVPLYLMSIINYNCN